MPATSSPAPQPAIQPQPRVTPTPALTSTDDSVYVGFSLTKQDVLAATRYIQAPMLAVLSMLVIAACAGIALSGHKPARFHETTAAFRVGSFVGLIIIVAFVGSVLTFLLRRQKWRRYGSMFTDNRYTFSTDSITLDMPPAGLHLAVTWDDVRALVVHQRRGLYLLVLWRPLLVYPIPIRAFTDPEAQRRFLALGREKGKLRSRAWLNTHRWHPGRP